MPGLQDVISVRRARALNRKTSACGPCQWNDESAKADCSTAIEDGELSERASRTRTLKISCLLSSKMASVEDAVHITTGISLTRDTTTILTVVKKFSFLMS